MGSDQEGASKVEDVSEHDEETDDEAMGQHVVDAEDLWKVLIRGSATDHGSRITGR